MTLRVGFAKREITPALGTVLAGRPSLVQRRARRVRDPLFVRALYIDTEHVSVACASCDMLLTTAALQHAAAKAARMDPRTLLLCATHTHSSAGGYWRGKMLEKFMGPYDSGAYDTLVSTIAQALCEARSSVARAEVRAGTTVLRAASVNRRTRGGKTDQTLSTLLFEVATGAPICLVSFGAHPVGVLERQPRSVSADYPGEICRRLELEGMRPLFMLGAAAGVSPSGLELELESHLDGIGQALYEGYRTCDMVPVGAELQVTSEPLALGSVSSRLFPFEFPAAQALEWASAPLRAMIDEMFREGKEDNQGLLLSQVRLGDVTILGLPFEVGPALCLALKSAAIEAGARIPMVFSMCNGYAGYAHMPSDYRCTRIADLRPLALYENAMSAAGWQIGTEVLRSFKALRTVP